MAGKTARAYVWDVPCLDPSKKTERVTLSRTLTSTRQRLSSRKDQSPFNVPVSNRVSYVQCPAIARLTMNNHCQRQAMWRSARPRPSRSVAPSATPTPGPATPPPQRPATSTRVEHRVVDVVVLGESTVAAAAAYSMAKAGKKVVLIRDMGLKADAPTPEVLHSVHIPAETLCLTHLNNEAAAYWRGIQSLIQRKVDPLVTPQATADLGVISGPHCADTLSRITQMEEMCSQSGVKIGSMRGGDIESVYPCLQSITSQHRTLLQPNGAVLNKQNIDEFLLKMAERNRCFVRDNLALKGWRDGGDHFSISAASRLMPDMISVFEAEQLLLAPDGWVPECLNLFGLSIEGIQLMEHSYNYCASGPELAKANSMPLLRYWGGLETDAALCYNARPIRGRPGTADAGGSTNVVADGSPEAAMFSHIFQSFPLLGGQSRMKIAAAQGSGQKYEGVGHAWAWKPEYDGNTMLTSYNRVTKFYQDLGPLEETMRTGLALRTPDALPLLGFHPGFEEGRVAIACTASSGGSRMQPRKAGAARRKTADDPTNARSSPKGLLVATYDARRSLPEGSQRPISKDGTSSTAGKEEVLEYVGSSADGYQLSPVLARFAADLISGAPIQDIEPELLSLTRDGLTALDVPRALNTWDGGLLQLQDGSFYTKKSRVALEEDEWISEQTRRAAEE